MFTFMSVTTLYPNISMGKIRKEKRHRLHLKTPGISSNPKTLAKDQDTVPLPLSAEEVPPLPDDILKSLPVLSLKGTEVKSEKSLQDSDRGRTKKEKRKLKREHWLKKIEVSKSRKEEEKAAELRRKTVIVGDMQPLATALPTLSACDNSKREKSKATITKASRTLLHELDHYRDVLKHPAFKQDPMATIFEHVQNSVATGTV